MSLKKHLEAAKEEYKARQRFLKTSVIHATSEHEIGKTACGLSEYQWEETPWEFLPIADSSKEVTCKNCLKAIRGK